MLRKTQSIEGPGLIGQSSKQLSKKNGIGSQRNSELGVTESSAKQAPNPLEERYNKLKQSKKPITRDILCETFGIDLSTAFLARFFDVMKVDADVDLSGFMRVANVLEGQSSLERQKIVFAMFDPTGQGRISKTEFRKVAAELMNGVTKTTVTASAAPTPAAFQAVAKPVIQMFTDTVFTVHCVDEVKGMEFKEWLGYAGSDPEVCRLIAALDRRSQAQDTAIRRRYLL